MIFITAENADMTEGRGPMQSTGVYDTLELAVQAVQGRGVMGVGDGEVYVANANERVQHGLTYSLNKVYGYRKYDGRWSYGYVYDHQVVKDHGIVPPQEDPEFTEYKRLKAKYGD